jgi:hypothetical protein
MTIDGENGSIPKKQHFLMERPHLDEHTTSRGDSGPASDVRKKLGA